MMASWEGGIAAAHPPMPRWMIGAGAARALIAIVLLAVAGFCLIGALIVRGHQASALFEHARSIEDSVDASLRDLLALEEAAQSFAGNGQAEELLRYWRLRAAASAAARAIETLAAAEETDSLQAVALLARTHQYLGAADEVIAQRQAGNIDSARALALALHAGPVGAELAAIRGAERARLESRVTREAALARLLLAGAAAAAGLIATLAVVVAHSTNATLRRRERGLKEGMLAESELLIREVDHRVRNSLNLVYSMLTFQQRRARADSALHQHLADAANRVLTVARVHDRLYRTDSRERIEAGGYVRDLCADVAAASLPSDPHSCVQVRADEAELPPEQAVCLGQIVVELVTNAIKFGKPTADAPVLVELAADCGRLTLAVADHGTGLPGGFDPQASAGLGMQVIGLLVRQLHGSLEVDRAWTGSRLVVTIPLASSAATRRWIDRVRRAG